ncbi:hypothetical protein WN944_027023 [Citrus x changshan-huyou]|uniref:Uncharacterized protein n=1 Tax=Citrus x changshan-huyou TaxID=2935761 RepID=A0AAP0LMY1_9ROSI
MSETDGSRVRDNIQSTESNEVSDMSPTAMEVQFGSKRKRSSRTSSKPPQPRKVMAPRSKETIRRATAKMIIIDELPFSHVKNFGFKHFCSVACPKFVVPSRRTITKDILDLFLAENASLKSLLFDKKEKVSLTMDIWTSIMRASYMVITSHFIDQDWQLRRRIISFNTISYHKGETIGKQLEKCLLDWGIEWVFTVSVDNASANKYVRSSIARLKAFQIRVKQEKILRKNGQPSRGSVVLDYSTRRNSTYTMLTTTLKFRSAFDQMANEDKFYDAYFCEEESGKKKMGPPRSYD